QDQTLRRKNKNQPPPKAAASQKCFNQQKLQPLTKTQKLDQSIIKGIPNQPPKEGQPREKTQTQPQTTMPAKNWH
ncbi:hypothetical protein, partial [Tessaracoccus lapidicaptus]|uniref:hypothetical protein n=1 Tax=Tessaracoccus lapidicaptus TaxID=1427523 RepID=UPI001C3FFEAC